VYDINSNVKCNMDNIFFKRNALVATSFNVSKILQLTKLLFYTDTETSKL
jgi:hypothetical protein